MTRYSILVAFAVVMLTSCSSFNNSFNTYTYKPEAVSTTSSDASTIPADADLRDEPTPEFSIAKADSDKGFEACPISPWPKPGTPPEYPYQQLITAGTDLAQVERIERKHIDALRVYVADRKRINREAMTAFNEQCMVVKKR